MIEAERAALAAESLHNSLSILEREMTITLNYLNNIATSAALLGGFVFGYIGPVDESVNLPLRTIFQGTATLSFGLLMYSVLLATLSSSLAPTKAFKDREHASMRNAIENLKNDQRKIIVAYQLGVSLFMILIALNVWISLGDTSKDYPVFIVVMIVILAIFIATVVAMRDMYKKYVSTSSSSSSTHTICRRTAVRLPTDWVCCACTGMLYRKA